jgi:FkbM family methyltransferase
MNNTVEMVQTKVNGMFDIILPKHRADREEWHTEKGWERQRLNSLMLNLGKKDVVYYVGAEEGEFPALINKYCGSQVVLFEPNPKVWPNMKAIWDANGLVVPEGMFEGFASDTDRIVGEEHTIKALHTDWPDHAKNEVIGNHGFKELNKEADTYDQIKIDTFVEVSGIVPTALSIDVEGAEGRVLRGAEKTLREHHPKIWLSLHPEFLLQEYKEWAYELRQWVMGLGYKEELLDYQHEIHLYYHV